MTPLDKNTCRGNWGTLLLPVKPDESIHYSRLSAEMDLLIAAGVNGIYSNGTAGEFHTQTENEFDLIHYMLAEKCNAANMPFQIGASHSVPSVTLDRVLRTKALAPSAYQVILPDWVPLTEKEAEDFLLTVSAYADPIPLVLYNPPHAKKVLAPASYAKIFEKVPSLIGAKLLDGDSVWYNEMQTVARQAAIFVPGHHLATGVQQGVASGAYSNVACINPRGAQQWWQLMEDDIKEAVAVQETIQSFFDAFIVPYAKAGYSNPALDKLLAAVGNWAPVGTRLRWPYRWIAEGEVMAVRKGAMQHLPGWFFQPVA
mgnify:CR=1 FL=1